MGRGVLWFAAAGISLLCCHPVFGDGVILNGVSAHTIGRGGTNLAHVDNGSILHDNPAAMGMIGGNAMVEIGTTMLLTDFHYADPENNTRAQHQLYGLPEFSYIRKRPCSPWTFGFGGFSPAGFGSIYNLNGPPATPFAGPERYKSFGSLMKVLAGAAYTPDDRLSVGGTIGVGYGMGNLEGPYILQTPPGLAGTPMRFDLEADGFAFVWSLGAMYRLSPRTTLGLAYQSQTDFTLGGRTHAFVDGLGNTTYDTDVDMKWPRSLGMGVRHRLCGCQVLSADVIWFNWSDAFDNFGINFTSSTNMLYPDIFEEFPLDWRDTVSVRLGYEKELGCGRVARLGYVYHRVPVPAATITPYIPAPLEHAVSAGYGWQCKGWNVDLSYMYTFGPRVRVAASNFLGGDFDQSIHRAQTHAISIGLIKTM